MDLYNRYLEGISKRQKNTITFEYDKDLARIIWKEKHRTKKLVKN